MYDLIIIGAGPAGISSGLYAKSRGLDTLILEKDKVGGVIADISIVSHYTGLIADETGQTFSQRIKDQAESAGLEIKYEEVTSLDLNDESKLVRTDNSTYEAKAIIIAGGTRARKLGIPGEDKLWGKGVGQNAFRDKDKYKGCECFVVGGSDGACKEAIYLSDYVKKVYIVYRGDEIRAIHEFKSIIESKDNIEVLENSLITEVQGQDHLEKIKIENSKTGQSEIYESDGMGVFIHTGGDPDTEIYKDIETEDGFILVDDKQRTNIEGVYAAGDIRKGQVKQIATAVADGCIAAINAYEYISSK